MAVRDAVFNTIQPKGLANIARKYNLSWQECAKLVGVSSYDLYAQGNIDGIIDYVPGEDDAQLKLRASIVTGVEFIENKTRAFVAENPYIIDHYRRNLERYLNPSARLHATNLRRPCPRDGPNGIQQRLWGGLSLPALPWRS